jgi:acetyltransferase-like isoleucine patch superfamily enzyme
MRGIAKAIGQSIAFMLVLPLWLTFRLLSSIDSANHSLVGHSQLIALIPGRFGSYVRVAFYRLVLEYCDSTACIEFGTLFSQTGTRIGKHVYIGPCCQIGLASLEDDVLIGSSVQIPSGPRTHAFERLDLPIREQPGQPQRVTVGRDSWIGVGCIVLADVAPQSVVGAGSVVTKCYPPQSIIAGNPAKILRSRNSDRAFVEDS